MRARMYRDDMERVVDEIENSEVMWLGKSKGMHGYEQVDTTVCNEVARLTRLYDTAVRTNTMNDPDTYIAGVFDATQSGLRKTRAPGPVVDLPVPALSIPEMTAAPAPLIPETTAASAPASFPLATGNSAAPIAVADSEESHASAPPKRQPRRPPKLRLKSQAVTTKDGIKQRVFESGTNNVDQLEAKNSDNNVDFKLPDKLPEEGIEPVPDQA